MLLFLFSIIYIGDKKMEMMKKSLIALTSTVMTLSVAAVPVFEE